MTWTGQLTYAAAALTSADAAAPRDALDQAGVTYDARRSRPQIPRDIAFEKTSAATGRGGLTDFCIRPRKRDATR
jgi:hypothetical protein